MDVELHSHRLWVGVDQGLSSGTNFAAAALSAGLLTDLDFGGWAIAYATFVVVLSTMRTFAGDAALIVLPSTNSSWRHMASGAASAACVGGALSATAVAAGSLLVGGATRAALLALAICLPALLLHDSLRMSLLAVGRSRAAAASDATWLVVSVAALLALRMSDTASPFLAMLAWAGASVPAVLVASYGGWFRPAWSALGEWWTATRHLSAKLLGAHLAYLAASMTMVTLVVGLVSTPRDAGSIRAAQTILGPVTVLLAAATLYAEPALVRRLSSDAAVLRFAAGLSAFALIVTISVSVLLWLTPSEVGTRIFGASWSPAHDLVPPMALVLGVGGAAVGAVSTLRAAHAVERVLIVYLAAAMIQIPLAWTIGRTAGVATVLIGYSVVSAVSAVALWYLALVKVKRKRRSDVRDRNIRSERPDRAEEK